MNSASSVRVRIAPSPTGLFHIGTARTALFNWLFARNRGGTFIVRIEDTDRERSRPEFEKDILRGLSWLGLEHDEFYRQSERGELYTVSLKRLLAGRQAFYCPHTPRELEEESVRQREAKEPLRHVCDRRDADCKEGIIRFRNNDRKEIQIHDLVHGDIQFDPALFGDFSIAKGMSEPLYNFAVVVDDYEMRISHVIRGEDHISNTPKQILMQRALGFPALEWAHLPLILGKDRSKLSKRHGALSITQYQSQGYLVEAMINFIVLLGWHPSSQEHGMPEKELFSRDEFIHEFSLERVQKGGAIAAFDKLDWLNREYLKRLDEKEFWTRAKSFFGESMLSSTPEATLKKILLVARSRIRVLGELEKIATTIKDPPRYTKVLLLWNGKLENAKTRLIVDDIIKILSAMDTRDFSKTLLEQALAPLVAKEGRGSVLWPLRAALSGEEASAGPFELADILGKDESLKRLLRARDILAAP